MNAITGATARALTMHTQTHLGALPPVRDICTLSSGSSSPTFLNMTPTQWKRVGTVALGAGIGSLALAPFGLGFASQAMAGFFSGSVLGNGLSNRGPFSDGVNALVNLAFTAGGLVGIPLLGNQYGALAAACVTTAAAGIGAAVIGCGPIRNWSTGIVRELHHFIRREDYP